MKTYSLDFHDFSILNNRFDLLLQLKEHYPQLKVSMFTIPAHVIFEKQLSAKIIRPDALKKLKQNLDWIELIPHGLFHLPSEFEKVSYDDFKNIFIPAIDESFKRDELPYVKGFCAPYWKWNEGIVKALDELGWWGAVDLMQHEMLTPKRYYKYTHSIDSFFYKSKKDPIKLHGHIDGVSANDFYNCFLNLFKIPSDAEFKFVSELVETL